MHNIFMNQDQGQECIASPQNIDRDSKFVTATLKHRVYSSRN